MNDTKMRSTDTEKWCPDCKRRLLHSAFGFNRANYRGLASICKPCRKIRMKERDRRREVTGLPPQSEEVRKRKKLYRQRLRKRVVIFLGGRCSSPKCRTVNEDGTRGCTDERCLQVDHVLGGGRKEYKALNHQSSLYTKILKDPTGYQLLCANCNWIKRHENNECPV